jgi:hypothetical protein
MLRVLLGGLPESDVTALVNLGDHNDITPVFLAIQRWVGGAAAVVGAGAWGAAGRGVCCMRLPSALLFR